MIEELEKLLNDNNISQDGQEKIIKGFKSVPFTQRRLIFGALKGHPDFTPIFIDLMNKKSKNLLDEEMDLIIKEEENLLKEAF